MKIFCQGIGENLQVRLAGLNMPVALPDVLSYDGTYVYMRSQRFDEDGDRQEIEVPTLNVSQQRGEGPHMFCPTGFLDDVWLWTETVSVAETVTGPDGTPEVRSFDRPDPVTLADLILACVVFFFTGPRDDSQVRLSLPAFLRDQEFIYCFKVKL